MRQNKDVLLYTGRSGLVGLMIFKNFAGQDWTGFNFIGSGLDSDWKISQSAHLWRIQKRKCSMLRQQLHTVFSL